ncbi:MAG: hypothetical protein C5B51_21150 [Terriglobia bacterium]|nr:MAG: hypothetical protein C5B51_21150 [Terriglobia bacterium]
MLKSWFPFSFQDELPAPNGVSRNGSPDRTAAAGEAAKEAESPARAPQPGAGESAKYLSFDQIYQHAAVKPPRIPYGILKVADMVNSTHLAGMSPEAKRCSLLMALEAAGVEIEDLLQDAVVRQRALNDYEEIQQNRVRDFEATKTEENNRIQAELDRLTSQYMSRIQANLDEVAREQDKLHAWQRGKHEESQRITEAATFCVPQGSAAAGGSLASVLERATLRK